MGRTLTDEDDYHSPQVDRHRLDLLDEDFPDPEDLEEEPPPPDGVSPRAWAKEHKFSGDRLDYARGLLARGLYDVSRHPFILAERWHVSLTKVKSIIAEAQRHLDFLAGKRSEEAGQIIVEKLLRVGQKAEDKGSFIAAVSAYKAAGEFTIDPKTSKQEVSHTYRLMSDAELDAAYQKELAEAQKAVGQLPAKPIIDAEFTEDGDRSTPVSPEDPSDPDGEA